MSIAALAALLMQAGVSSSTPAPVAQSPTETKTPDQPRKWGNLTLAPGVSRPAIMIGDPNWWDDRDRPLDVSPDVHGRTVINFTISTDGRISRCEIFQSSGDKRLDRMTCKLAMERARFQPELDLDGKPMESHGRRASDW